jgi:geranylgeranyl diphosphate synthase type I
MVRGKSGALLAAAAAISAVLAGQERKTVDALYRFGMDLGVAFQIRDDALGTWGDAAAIGKSTGDDIRDRKVSFPIAHALANASEADRGTIADLYSGSMDERGAATVLEVLARAGAREATERRAAEAAQAAIDALASVPLDHERREELAALARYAATRLH